MTDIELWTRILKGDKVAFEELYHRYYSPLFGYALRLNFDEETIKDCLQDMFVKIYVSHSSLPTLSYVKSYLYRTITKCSGDILIQIVFTKHERASF